MLTSQAGAILGGNKSRTWFKNPLRKNLATVGIEPPTFSTAIHCLQQLDYLSPYVAKETKAKLQSFAANLHEAKWK